MWELILFNSLLLVVISAGLMLCKKYIKKERSKNLLLFVSAAVTIVCHYSTFLYLLITNGAAMQYLKENPNLLLPIYPCNVVMWGCLIYGFMRNKQSKGALFLADYLFWFGIFSTLVGMFANVEFINNPTLKDYEVTKSILAHATLLFNVLLLCVFGRIQVNLVKNMVHIGISVVMMYAIGVYCNKIFEVLVSPEAASSVNSMFILHSPFAGVPFLRYPIIAASALVLYFGLFSLCEVLTYPKGKRWFNRIKNKQA